MKKLFVIALAAFATLSLSAQTMGKVNFNELFCFLFTSTLLSKSYIYIYLRVFVSMSKKYSMISLFNSNNVGQCFPCLPFQLLEVGSHCSFHLE